MRGWAIMSKERRMLASFGMEGWVTMKRRILRGHGVGEDYTQSSKVFNDRILSIRQGRCLVKCRLVGGKWFSSQSSPKVIITCWIQFGVAFTM